MKKTLTFLFLILITLSGFSQVSFKGFFKATVNNDRFVSDKVLYKLSETKITPIIRPAIEINAMEITKSQVPGKGLEISSIQKGGVGLSLAFFKTENGITTNNWAINALALMPLDYKGETGFNVSPALTIQGLQFLNIGGGYDTGFHRWFGLFGITYNFSKVQ